MVDHYRKLSWNGHITSLNTTFTSVKSSNNDKLQAINERILAKAQLQLMKNRVNQLVKAKEIAENEIHKAKLQAKEIKRKIKRREEKAMKKTEMYKAQLAFEEKQRKKFNKERMQRQNNISKFERKIVKANKFLADELKQKRKSWDDTIVQERNSVIEEKVAKRKVISKSYVDALKVRCISQRNYREKLKEEYELSIQTEREIQENANKEIKELEKTEIVLLDELSKTIEMRNCCFENLNKLKTV